MKLYGKDHIVIYFEGWQMRMIKDFLKVDCSNWPIDLTDLSNMGIRYKVGDQKHPFAKRMYLTEWQRREIKEVSGFDCNYVELVKGSIQKYGVPAEDLAMIAESK